MAWAGAVGSPAVLVIVGVSTALYGLHPHLLPLATAVVVFGGLAAFFGNLLDVPPAVQGLSPWYHTPGASRRRHCAAVDRSDWVAFALVAVGLVAFRRRDLRSP